MSLDSVLNGEYLEYFIIGTHTSVWIALFFSWMLNIPFSRLTSINVLVGVLLIPFIYLIGLLMDSVSQLLLRQFRKLISRMALKKAGIAGNSADISQTDEAIAVASPTLYAGYDWRMRRSKVVGAAIFNWIALGATVLTIVGAVDSPTALVVEIATLALAALSVFSWIDLTSRAYAYRSRALRVIQTLPQKPVSE